MRVPRGTFFPQSSPPPWASERMSDSSSRFWASEKRGEITPKKERNVQPREMQQIRHYLSLGLGRIHVIVKVACSISSPILPLGRSLKGSLVPPFQHPFSSQSREEESIPWKLSQKGEEGDFGRGGPMASSQPTLHIGSIWRWRLVLFLYIAPQPSIGREKGGCGRDERSPGASKSR